MAPPACRLCGKTPLDFGVRAVKNGNGAVRSAVIWRKKGLVPGRSALKLSSCSPGPVARRGGLVRLFSDFFWLFCARGVGVSLTAPVDLMVETAAEIYGGRRLPLLRSPSTAEHDDDITIIDDRMARQSCLFCETRAYCSTQSFVRR
jgi:hypothetical protein